MHANNVWHDTEAIHDGLQPDGAPAPALRRPF
jgi:hypothetical protein